MKLVSIVGARPQFVKVAPISWRANGLCEHLIVNTGQHYDPLLSDVFFEELNIPNPIYNIYSGSGTHAEQTAKILVGAEKILQELKPDAILIYGDTNSTLAAGLAAAKLGIKIGHIEAGLRSFNRAMPEEINRVVSDHISEFLFAPTTTAVTNLKNEGLGKKTHLIGDIMVETLAYVHEKASAENSKINLQPYIFSTIHRAENTDSPARLAYIIERLSRSSIPVKLFAHPRLIRAADEAKISLEKGAISVFGPIPYESAIREIINSVGVISDSGGIQKESYLLGKPQLSIRGETEWVETLSGGWNRLDPNLDLIVTEWWTTPIKPIDGKIYGNGDASLKIISIIQETIAIA